MLCVTGIFESTRDNLKSNIIDFIVIRTDMDSLARPRGGVAPRVGILSQTFGDTGRLGVACVQYLVSRTDRL